MVNEQSRCFPLIHQVGENSAIIDNPLHEASKRGNIPFVQELLKAGVSVNGKFSTSRYTSFGLIELNE